MWFTVRELVYGYLTFVLHGQLDDRGVLLYPHASSQVSSLIWKWTGDTSLISSSGATGWKLLSRDSLRKHEAVVVWDRLPFFFFFSIIF